MEIYFRIYKDNIILKQDMHQEKILVVYKTGKISTIYINTVLLQRTII
jgi:hypothetical protein